VTDADGTRRDFFSPFLLQEYSTAVSKDAKKRESVLGKEEPREPAFSLLAGKETPVQLVRPRRMFVFSLPRLIKKQSPRKNTGTESQRNRQQ
jgi:hypothetical protein